MKKKLLHISSILAIFAFIFLAFGSDDDNSSSSTATNKMLAYSYAEDFVKKRLKSPSTAEFPGLFEKAEHITELGNDEYLISSWVDSQNGFGAMLRSNFSCKIIFIEGKVKVEGLIIE
jgi:hypothetical protein